MNNQEPSLCVLMIVKNEEGRIARALGSASWVRKKIVIDGGSHDRTCEIARSMGAEIHHRAFDTFDKQRVFALSKANTEWVLGLDADEIVSPQLAASVRQITGQSNTPFDGYQILRKNYFWGKHLRHLSKDEWLLRLFRSRAAGVTNTPVHEGYVMDAPTGRIDEGHLDHYTYESVEQFIRKANLYTTLAAPDVVRRKKPIRLIDLFTHPLSSLWKHLIAHQGYRDGAPGVVLSLLHATCNLLEYIKAYEYQAGFSKPNQSVDPPPFSPIS